MQAVEIVEDEPMRQQFKAFAVLERCKGLIQIARHGSRKCSRACVCETYIMSDVISSEALMFSLPTNG